MEKFTITVNLLLTTEAFDKDDVIEVLGDWLNDFGDFQVVSKNIEVKSGI
jgi:hypothetical protein